MKLVAALLLGLFLLLGVQRTPEAQVGEAITLTAGIIAVGGCAHAVATARLDAAMMSPQTETPATP